MLVVHSHPLPCIDAVVMSVEAEACITCGGCMVLYQVVVHIAGEAFRLLQCFFLAY